MEINKELINYIKGLLEEINGVNDLLLKPGPHHNSLLKKRLMLINKIQAHLGKMNQRAHGDINRVLYKSIYGTQVKYFQQYFPLSKEEIEIYFEVGNIVTNSKVEIISITPLTTKPIEIEYYEKIQKPEKEKASTE